MDPRHLHDYVIRPALQHLGPDFDSLAARRLLLGTAMVESGLQYLRQIGGGPALGLWQIEPATHVDIYKNWLYHRPKVMERLNGLKVPGRDVRGQLQWNLAYACAIARLIYYRDQHPLPEADSAGGLTGYWKRVFNTHLGAGIVGEALPHFQKSIDLIPEAA